jgi:lysophospholipid acyltransferase (LPLAT)-like uncharacterized protein
VSGQPPVDTKGLWRDAAKLWAIVTFGLLAVRLLASTWRFRTRNAEGWQRLRAARKAYVLALWHGSLLPLTYRHRNQQITVVVSEHRDGEIIARMIVALGNRTVRGSTTRGGSRALLAMIRELERGFVVAITPDGPRGPALSFQAGAVVAAHRAGVPLVGILLHVDRAWRLKSWDGFVIPKPFARLTIAYTDPTMVGGTSSREAAEDTARFQELMRAAQEVADAP